MADPVDLRLDVDIYEPREFAQPGPAGCKRRNFLRRINEDPSLAFRMFEGMSHRVREPSREAAELKSALDERMSTEHPVEG